MLALRGMCNFCFHSQKQNLAKWPSLQFPNTEATDELASAYAKAQCRCAWICAAPHSLSLRLCRPKRRGSPNLSCIGRSSSSSRFGRSRTRQKMSLMVRVRRIQRKRPQRRFVLCACLCFYPVRIIKYILEPTPLGHFIRLWLY